MQLHSVLSLRINHEIIYEHRPDEGENMARDGESLRDREANAIKESDVGMSEVAWLGFVVVKS